MTYLDRLMSAGEEVRLVARGHWIVILRPLLVYFLALGVLVLVAGVAFGYGSETWSPVVGVSGLLLALIPVALLTIMALRWRARQYVVTTRRVLQLDGVFNRRMSDSNLDKVNDIVLTHSLLGRILGYGDIEIITGSDRGADVFHRIADPVAFKRAILDNKEDLDTLLRLAAEPDDQAGGSVPDAIERLAALRDKGLIDDEEFERKKDDLLARM